MKHTPYGVAGSLGPVVLTVNQGRSELENWDGAHSTLSISFEIDSFITQFGWLYKKVVGVNCS